MEKSFKIQHKYCGYTKIISGYNVWDALKSNDLDYTVWNVIEVM